VGEHLGGGRGVGEGVVVVDEADAVAGADVGEPVGELAFGVEASREVEGAQRLGDVDVVAVAARPAADELRVERGVVRREHGAVEPPQQLGHGNARRGGAAEPAAGEPVDVGGPDAAPRPAQPHERLPAVEHGAVGLDGDDADLQHVVAARPQPGGLQVDDGERRQSHGRDLTPTL